MVHSKSREYYSWGSMIARCENPSRPDWPRYGGKGIRVCWRWHNFLNFLSDMGPRPAGTTLDRIDSNGNYEPGNCRWADAVTQSRNRKGIGLAVCRNGHPKKPFTRCHECKLKTSDRWRRKNPKPRLSPDEYRAARSAATLKAWKTRRANA